MQVLGWCQRPLAAIGIVLALGTSAFAQSGLADIRGTVVDDSNAALPGVSVTATHIDTGTSRTAVTSTTGVFLMPALQVGRYKLQLELAGFNTVIQENLLLEVGQSAALSFTMKIAALQETVTVAGESPLVEASNPISPAASVRRRWRTCRSTDATGSISWRSYRGLAAILERFAPDLVAAT